MVKEWPFQIMLEQLYVHMQKNKCRSPTAHYIQKLIQNESVKTINIFKQVNLNDLEKAVISWI